MLATFWAKTAGGLTGSEIAKYFVEYAMQFDRKIKFTDSRFSNDGQLLSKRDGLKENLYCFVGSPFIQST